MLSVLLLLFCNLLRCFSLLIFKQCAFRVKKTGFLRRASFNSFVTPFSLLLLLLLLKCFSRYSDHFSISATSLPSSSSSSCVSKSSIVNRLEFLYLKKIKQAHIISKENKEKPRLEKKYNYAYYLKTILFAKQRFTFFLIRHLSIDHTRAIHAGYSAAAATAG